MPDGSHVVKVDGQLFRALSPAKVEELANQKDQLAVCQANEKRFTDKVALADANVKIAEQQTAIERGNFVRVMQLYTAERELRQQSMQFIPHSGKSNWLLKALDSPYSQAFWKMALPMATFIKGVRSN